MLGSYVCSLQGVVYKIRPCEHRFWESMVWKFVIISSPIKCIMYKKIKEIKVYVKPDI
jgi:hypothetical protein